MGLLLYIYLMIVFITVVSSIMVLDYYAITVGMGDADYMALMVGIVCMGFLGGVYYYLFNNLSKIFEKPPKKSKRRYYEDYVGS